MTATMRTAEVAISCSNILGETPIWDRHHQCLYWVDIRAPALHRLDRDGAHRWWPMPELSGAVVSAEGGGVIIAQRRGIVHFDPETGNIRHLLDIESPGIDNRLNEAKCDRRGRLWIGSMRDFGAATEGSLYRIDADLAVTRMLSEITIPNSLAWSPDNRFMYFADSATGLLKRFEFDLETGELGGGSIFIDKAEPGRPDGCTVDSEGCVWNARAGGGEVLRLTPDGEVVERVSLGGVTTPTACALGGPDLTTLYITTAKQRLSAEELAAQPHAGDLFSITVDVAGLPEPSFRSNAIQTGLDWRQAAAERTFNPPCR